MAQSKQEQTSSEATRGIRVISLNGHLIFGAVVLSFVILFSLVGPLFVDKDDSLLGSFAPEQRPFWIKESEKSMIQADDYPHIFGTDLQGRDIFTTLVYAAAQTLQVGTLTGLISLGLGAMMGVLAGFFPGRLDNSIRFFGDILVAIPTIAFLMVFVARMDDPSIWVIALSIAALSWPGAARAIRSQVLSLRERQYIAIARANGEREIEVLFREVLPNILPLLLAQFIGAVNGGIGTAMALEVLGLVPTRRYLSLGLMIFWVQRMGGILRGMWWWWGPPILLIAFIFTGLLFLSSGMNVIVNPRLAGYGAQAKRRTQARLKQFLAARRMAAKTMTPPDETAILEVRNLHVVYETEAGPVKAVNDVSFSIKPGERMGLIGESGSGKTTAAVAMMRLSRPPAFITQGQVFLEGRDLMTISDEELRRMRLKEIAMVPQAAMNALNPVMRIEDQIKDGLVVHTGRMSKTRLDQIVADVLDMVNLPQDIAKAYPHQLSGGMKQRATMAIAVALRPKVIIADEPTSALDVVVQKRVMVTLMQLQKELGAAVMLIGHDIGLMTQFVDTLGVLYAGRLVEWAPVEAILNNAYHPYSRMLIESLPTLTHKKALMGIPGMPPQLLNLPSGCPFVPRCPFAFDRCLEETPAPQSPEPGRRVACHLYPSHSVLPPLPVREINPAVAGD
ncbi:MAG: dipeptide/oligopeptide/nickel ABC transporter permease/ATP-binding protein [Anaerolineae bacterium]|nr:dipeptide/oligopeptide/nickel ABC transporter permease/ATP-binding protein [Anaerolineae bacterium]